MINKLLLIFLLIQTSLFSQEKETILIQKSEFSLYRGVLAETKSWYLLIDTENNYYLANLDRPNDGVYDWFIRFKDSQNIYKSSAVSNSPIGGIGNNQYPTLHFKKENEPTDILNFYLDKSTKDTIILTSLTDGIVYYFELQK